MITYHHIGGRNGTFPLPLKDSNLLQDLHLVLYDADPDCYEQVINAEKGPFGKVSVYPYCIGQETKTCSFNVNFHPTTNSLYEFNQKYKEYTFVSNPRYGEYVLGNACKFVKKIELEQLSLEEALKRSSVQEIDLLTLDVQGAEYDVIAGAEKLIKENCLCIQLEVEFVKLYNGQKTFSEINDLLDKMGFELIELYSFGRCAPISLPIGFRGLEQPLYAEAVYIKKFSELLIQKDEQKLYKWALLNLIYKKVGLCLKALKVLSRSKRFKNKTPDDPLYINFLREVWATFSEEGVYELPKFGELFSKKMLSDFYRHSSNNPTDLSTEKESINETLRKKYLPLLPDVESLEKKHFSSFEALLKEYGLNDVADAVKEKRQVESNCFLELMSSLV